MNYWIVFSQALVTTEPLSRGRRSFKQTMSELLQIASQSINKENTAQVTIFNNLTVLQLWNYYKSILLTYDQ